MSKWHYLSIILLSLILVIVLWQSPPQLLIDSLVDKKPAQKRYPEAYLVNTTTTQFNEQGKLSHILKSARIDYFAETKGKNDGYSLMDSPDMQFYSDTDITQPTWHISASQGHSDLQGNEILLTNNVVLTQKNIDGEIVQIFAENLFVNTNEQYAITRKPVMIKSPSSTTTADGLEIWLNTEVVKLLANVKTLYKKP